MSRQGQYRQPTFDNIKAFWEAEAKEIGSTPTVTIRDHYFRIHELHSLLPLIPACTRLLDIGCGTGFGTLAFARRASERALGVDYSEQMIVWAHRLKNDAQYRRQLATELSPLWDLGSDEAAARTDFAQGDATRLALEGGPFDVITGQRILINLPEHDIQMGALRGLRAHAAEGAWLLLTEATRQGHARTDAYREQFGVPALEKYWHNKYVDEDRFPDWTTVGWRVTYDLGFEVYTLLSKVVYPAALGQDNCRFLSGANAAAMEVACTFRSKAACDEIGVDKVLDLYAQKVAQYDPAAGPAVERWLAANGGRLGDWGRIGHQRLVVARAV